MRVSRSNRVLSRAAAAPVHRARVVSGKRTGSRVGGGRRLTRWSGGTIAGLLAVTLIFGDALLTVEVHKVSMDTDRLRRELEKLELELGTLESEWASRSSRLELEERAWELGLTVPEPDQVVLLPSAFLDEAARDRMPNSAELRRALVYSWMLINPVGIP